MWCDELRARSLPPTESPFLEEPISERDRCCASHDGSAVAVAMPVRPAEAARIALHHLPLAFALRLLALFLRKGERNRLLQQRLVTLEPHTPLMEHLPQQRRLLFETEKIRRMPQELTHIAFLRGDEFRHGPFPLSDVSLLLDLLRLFGRAVLLDALADEVLMDLAQILRDPRELLPVMAVHLLDEFDRLYRALTEILRADLPVTRLVPWTNTTFAHRRVRGPSALLLAQPDRYMEDLWLETKP